MGKLAFFPWLELETPVNVGDYRLLQYRRNQSPGVDAAEQGAIDIILTPYQAAHGQPVSRATILQHVSQPKPTDPIDETLHTDLFVVAELVAFAGLANRQFFGHFGYSNRDHYRIIIQEFGEPGKGVLITTRRRDGSTNSFFSGDTYKIRRPDHVGHERVKLGEELLTALTAAVAHPEWPELYQAIALFNEANTDRPEVPTGTEVILTYAALEQALGRAGASTADVATAFCKTLPPLAELPRDKWRAPASNPRAAKLLEKASSLRAAWVQDLANSRGSLAHGHALEAYPACWRPHEHLLIGAHVLPLVIKRRLDDMVGYQFTTTDRASVEAFEPLLNTDHFASKADDEDFKWPDIVSTYRMKEVVRHLAEKWGPSLG